MADDDTVHGLTVHAYASIYAATAEGFPLEIVLDHVGIGAEDWAAIDEAWSKALADDLEQEGPLGGKLEVAMTRTQESYRRAIPPLDDDVDAWMRFSRAWSASPDSSEFLRARGLEETDVVRLHRRWSARMEKEPALQKRALELMQEESPMAPAMKRPAPLELRLPLRRTSGTVRISMMKPEEPAAPSLLAAMPPPAGGALFIPTRAAPSVGIDDGLATSVETRALVIEEESTTAGLVLGDVLGLVMDSADDVTLHGASPFDAVRLADDFELPPPESVAMPSVSHDLSLAQYASLRAELEVFSDQEEMVFAKYGLTSPERRAAVDAAWQERLGSQTDTYAEWRQLYRHFLDHWGAVARA